MIYEIAHTKVDKQINPSRIVDVLWTYRYLVDLDMAIERKLLLTNDYKLPLPNPVHTRVDRTGVTKVIRP